QKLKCCQIEAKLIGYPRAAEPPRLCRKKGLPPRCQYAPKRALQGSHAGAVAGDGTLKVRYRRSVAQEPEGLRVYKALDHLVEGKLGGTLDHAIERVDAAPERRQLEHLARREEGVGDIGTRALRLFRQPRGHGWAAAVHDGIGEPERDDLATKAVPFHLGPEACPQSAGKIPAEPGLEPLFIR